jgi:hypothetical protein
MSTINYNNKLDSDQFYFTFTTLSSMNAKRDLVNVRLTGSYNIFEQFVEWIKSFISDETNLSYQNINLNVVAENIHKFVMNNKCFLNDQLIDAPDSYKRLIENIKMIQNRFVKKHSQETAISETTIFQNLKNALKELEDLKKLQPTK